MSPGNLHLSCFTQQKEGLLSPSQATIPAPGCEVVSQTANTTLPAALQRKLNQQIGDAQTPITQILVARELWRSSPASPHTESHPHSPDPRGSLFSQHSQEVCSCFLSQHMSCATSPHCHSAVTSGPGSKSTLPLSQAANPLLPVPGVSQPPEGSAVSDGATHIYTHSSGGFKGAGKALCFILTHSGSAQVRTGCFSCQDVLIKSSTGDGILKALKRGKSPPSTGSSGEKFPKNALVRSQNGPGTAHPSARSPGEQSGPSARRGCRLCWHGNAGCWSGDRRGAGVCNTERCLRAFQNAKLAHSRCLLASLTHSLHLVLPS